VDVQAILKMGDPSDVLCIDNVWCIV
jgi:hypothetical protein